MQRKKSTTEVTQEKLEEMTNPTFSPTESRARHPLSKESVSEIFDTEANSNAEETVKSIQEVKEELIESVPTSGIAHRISSKQRRMSLEEYRNTFL